MLSLSLMSLMTFFPTYSDVLRVDFCCCASVLCIRLAWELLERVTDSGPAVLTGLSNNSKCRVHRAFAVARNFNACGGCANLLVTDYRTRSSRPDFAMSRLALRRIPIPLLRCSYESSILARPSQDACKSGTPQHV